MKLFIVLCCLVGLSASKPVPQDDQQPPTSVFSPHSQSDISSLSDTPPSDFSAVGTGLSPSPSFGDSSSFGSDSSRPNSFGSDTDGALISSPDGFSSDGSSVGSEFPSSSFAGGSGFQDPALDPNSGFNSQFHSSDGSGSSFILPQSGSQSFSDDGTQFVGDASNFDAAFSPPGADLLQTSPDSSDDSKDSSDDDADNQSGGLFGFGKKK